MDLWDEIKKLSGYQSGNSGVDSYGVDHSGFSTRDELEYQSARLARENQLAENFSKQGIAEENYPQLGTNFWGGTPENNYGFGTSNISQNIENVAVFCVCGCCGLFVFRYSFAPEFAFVAEILECGG